MDFALQVNIDAKEYDPKIGFRIPKVTVADSGHLICTVSNGNNTKTTIFVLRINRKCNTILIHFHGVK